MWLRRFARIQILAARRARGQCLWRSQSCLLVCGPTNTVRSPNSKSATRSWPMLARCRRFIRAQGGEVGASPQRAVTTEPTPATDKRPAARRVFAQKTVWLRCSSVKDPQGVFSCVARRHPAFSPKTARLVVFNQALDRIHGLVAHECILDLRAFHSVTSLHLTIVPCWQPIADRIITRERIQWRHCPLRVFLGAYRQDHLWSSPHEWLYFLFQQANIVLQMGFARTNRQH